MVWLPDGKNSLTICFAVSTEYRRVSDGRTDILQQHCLRYMHSIALKKKRNSQSGYSCLVQR